MMKIRSLPNRFTYYFISILSVILLSACDRLGFPDPSVEAGRIEANAKATGSACRHAGRAIEDCYTLNPQSPRSAVYAGWKEMNDYMRENKIEEIKPIVALPSHAASSSASASASEHGEETASESASAEEHSSPESDEEAL